jgi:hypothetical protein
MGRLRKALSIGSVIATGGAIGTPVKWESNAEKAAKEQKRLLAEQNTLITQQNMILSRQQRTAYRRTEMEQRAALDADTRPTLAQLEQRVGIRTPESETTVKVCIACLNKHCEEHIDGEAQFTTYESECVCNEHHGRVASVPLAICCLKCLELGCDKTAKAPVTWTRDETECGCRTHHGA